MPKGFYRVPGIQFALEKMQHALHEVDSRVARQSPLGERDIQRYLLDTDSWRSQLHHRRKRSRFVLE